MRFIRKRIGNITGKKLLDAGCGLGEASVFFALEGAHVTALDLSLEMLDAAKRLADLNKTTLRCIKGSANKLPSGFTDKFDIIYAGNLFHHVDIKQALETLTPRLNPNGLLVSWDPLAYNPVINIYRLIATKVRTPGEHPLRLSDIRLFRSYFSHVETYWFWFTTLTVFIIMFALCRRNPNKERYWKTVVEEGARWKPLYTPLEKLDGYLLRYLPFLRPLCWNVVIAASGPRHGGSHE